MKPGIHDGIAAEQYHADPAEQPSLSASIAHLLVSQSPAHAWANHPKNPDRVAEEAVERFELGTTVHALLLQDDDLIEVCDFPDWRTKDAKTAREEARAAGRIPLLPDQAARARAMVAAVRQQLDAHPATPPLFTDGKPEQTLVWEDDHGVVCRARVDWLHNDHATIDDLKTTAASASPRAWNRTMWNIGAAFQAQFYRRGVEKLTGIRPAFRFCVVETTPPYAMSVVALDPSAEAVADSQIAWALRTWAECVETGEWPAYTPQVAYLEVPTYIEADWLERTWEAA